MRLKLNAGSGRRKTQLVLIDQALVSAANFTTGLLLARFLGPSNYGQFTLTYNLILLASGIQMALISAPMQVVGPQQSRNSADAYYRSVLRLQAGFSLLLGLIGLVALAVLGRLFPHWGLTGLALPVGLAAALFVAQDFVRRFFFVRDVAVAALLSDVAAHGLRVLVLVALGWSIGLTAQSAFWVIALTCALGVTALGLKPAFWAGASDRRALAHYWKEHWRSGKWLLADTVVFWFGGQMVVFYVAGHVLSAEAVGKIAAAMNVVGVANILFLALENFVPSRAAHMYASSGRAGLVRYMRRVGYLGACMTLAIAVVTSLFNEFWLKLFYGEAYAGSGALVVWWGVYYVFGFLIRPFAYGLRVLGNTRAMFLSTACGALVSAVVSYPFVRFGGMNGAMLAMCVVQVVVCLTIATLFLRALRAQPHGRPESSNTG